ncbi:MAG: Rrf2 family transcriptional regulator [Anaerolineae bacterium]|nr:Rrf2 family transcriptional regulator [Anaerolineae bacterium]
MKLTTKSEYALLALLFLAREFTRDAEDYHSVETIAAAQDIPAKYLEQLMLTLKRARYVRSARGQQGGYRLAKSPDTISVAEIIRLFDGALAPTESVSKYFYESTPVEKEAKLVNLFGEIREWISFKLESTTLADMS